MVGLGNCMTGRSTTSAPHTSIIFYQDNWTLLWTLLWTGEENGKKVTNLSLSLPDSNKYIWSTPVTRSGTFLFRRNAKIENIVL